VGSNLHPSVLGPRTAIHHQQRHGRLPDLILGAAQVKTEWALLDRLWWRHLWVIRNGRSSKRNRFRNGKYNRKKKSRRMMTSTTRRLLEKCREQKTEIAEEEEKKYTRKTLPWLACVRNRKKAKITKPEKEVEATS